MAAIPANTKLLLPFDGADASTTITDATGNHTVTARDNAQIDTAQSKFGGASGLLDGAGSDCFSIPDHADWDIFGLATQDVTIGFFIRPTGTTDRLLLRQRLDSNNFYTLEMSSGNIYFGLKSGGTDRLSLSGTSGILANAWTHVALIKKGGATWNSGLYIDGVQKAHASGTGAWTIDAPLVIGGNYVDPDYVASYAGHFDDFIVVAGNPFNASPVAGLTDTITVPTEAWGTVSFIPQVIII